MEIKVSHESAKLLVLSYNSLPVETQLKVKLMSKRMQLKLDDETYALIQELSELSGMSASSLVTVMFQVSRVDLQHLITRIKYLGEKPAHVFDSVVSVLEQQGYSHQGTLSIRRAKNSRGDKSNV
ncbi:MAG: hypothetical protein HOG41_21605 [Gammaproteobacteria bacterium]|jgi:hypothetical protein|nr:hypothetical protein [Gammaproteobacteria bacterium]MBT4087464.1 hypothetical protein [Deltaproteobacteria bacterium]MBT4860706.1 hypothetical protein [Gammaproteobacteria bacterium]MBT7206458.1 hypothetical protein [Gammaproteobacteria bacterium]